jgi:hypothetical protein
VAPPLEAQSLAGGAVGEGHVVVGDLVEEVDLVAREQEACGDGVNGGVAPALVEEAAFFV